MPIIPAVSGKPLAVSCLCVTEARAAFLPWLYWNYQKQAYRHRELIVVDAGGDGSLLPSAAGARVLHCPPGTSVARKRNLALEAARGDVVAWFDDDDWQHPRRLSLLVAGLGDGAALAGSLESWFVDLARGRARAHRSQRSVLFNGLGVRRDALDGARFDERRARAADTAWLAQVGRAAGGAPVIVPAVLSFWLCHRDNLSNPARRYVFPHPLAAVREAVGERFWGETEAQLDALRARLGSAGDARPGTRG